MNKRPAFNEVVQRIAAMMEEFEPFLTQAIDTKVNPLGGGGGNQTG